jgi:hypothetical protein
MKLQYTVRRDESGQKGIFCCRMADKEGKGLVDENEFLEIMMTTE